MKKKGNAGDVDANEVNEDGGNLLGLWPISRFRFLFEIRNSSVLHLYR